MGRRNTIDRGHVLAVAEQIVNEFGAGALTIDAVAKAAGITKGGVQSCFGTKEGLIAAMLERWIEAHEARVQELLPAAPTQLDLLRLHVQLTASDDVDAQRRVAGLLSALLDSPTHLEQIRDWYRAKMRMLPKNDNAAQVAFLATEGAFFLRYLGLIEYSEKQWKAIFTGISKSLP